MKKLISMLLVLVMCTLALTSCGGVNGPPESVVEAAMGLMEDPDVKTLKNLLPEVAWETLYDEADMDEDEFWEDVEDSFEEAKEMMEDYEGYKFSFEIDEVDDMKRSEVKDLNEELEDFLDDDIEEAAVVTVEVAFSFEFDGEEIDEESEREFTVFKYDGDWYLVPGDLSTFW